MLTPAFYGFLPNGAAVTAPASYYWQGIGGVSTLKFRNTTGWLSGVASPLLASNLPVRDVVRYSGANRTTRFSATPQTSGVAVFVGQFGKNWAVFPILSTWQVFGVPSNAT
jgi:hypothetical protein